MLDRLVAGADEDAFEEGNDGANQTSSDDKNSLVPPSTSASISECDAKAPQALDISKASIPALHEIFTRGSESCY